MNQTKPSDLPSCDPSHVSTSSVWNCLLFSVFPSRTAGISHASADARLPPWARAVFPLMSPLVQILFAHVPPKLILPKVWMAEQDCGLKTTCNYLQISSGTDPPLQEVWARLLAWGLFSFSHCWHLFTSAVFKEINCFVPSPHLLAHLLILFSHLRWVRERLTSQLKVSNDWRSKGRFPVLSPSWIMAALC